METTPFFRAPIVLPANGLNCLFLKTMVIETETDPNLDLRPKILRGDIENKFTIFEIRARKHALIEN